LNESPVFELRLYLSVNIGKVSRIAGVQFFEFPKCKNKEVFSGGAIFINARKFTDSFIEFPFMALAT
jgi:hypothetical protein